MQAKDIKRTDWDNTASEYSSFPLEGPLLVPCRRMLEVMQATLSFSSATTIMDVGCGPGTAVSLLIDHYGGDIPPEAQLIATDYSSGMVEAIKSRKETEISSGKDTASYWSRVETLVLDAQDLSGLSSDSVSHIMGSLVYFMLPDPKRGLREAHRVLKAGGVFACTSWAKVEWMQFLGQAVQEVRSAGGLNSKPIEIPMLPTEWKDKVGVKGELEDVGFCDVNTEYVEFNWAVEDPGRFAKMMAKGSNPGTKMLLGDLSSEERDRVCQIYAKIIGQHGNVCKGVAVLGIGRK